MGAHRQGEQRTARLARERALYQYTSALDRGDFATVAAVLHEAETDEVLERMLLEIDDVYRGELAEVAAASCAAAHEARFADRQAVRKGRRGGEMTDKKGAPDRRPLLFGQRVAPGLIVGAVVAAVLVTCIGAVVLASTLRGGIAPQMASSDLDEAGFAPPSPPEPWVVEEVVVEREAMAPGDAGEAASSVGAGSAVAQGLEGGRLIIRTGTITLRVEDTLAAQQAVEDLVARWSGEGAYVVSNEQRGGEDDGDPYVSMAIRVPAARFGAAMDTIAELAVNVESRTESSDDVTEEYVDLEGRLEALETARDRLLEIMSEANRTEDLLQAEEQLTRREAEIEATKGRMQYLSQSAALARIWIELQPYVLSQPVGQRWRPAETVREALEALVDGAQGLVDFVLFFAIAVLPWLVVLGLGAYLLYRIVRWAVRRREAAADTPDTASRT